MFHSSSQNSHWRTHQQHRPANLSQTMQTIEAESTILSPVLSLMLPMRNLRSGEVTWQAGGIVESRKLWWFGGSDCNHTDCNNGDSGSSWGQSGNYSRFFMCFNSFNSHQSPEKRYVLSSFRCYKWENWEKKKVNTCPKLANTQCTCNHHSAISRPDPTTPGHGVTFPEWLLLVGQWLELW